MNYIIFYEYYIMNHPIDLVNHILSYRPRHPVACLIFKEANHYNLHLSPYSRKNEPFYFYFLKRNKSRQITIKNNKQIYGYTWYEDEIVEWYDTLIKTTYYDFKICEWNYNYINKTNFHLYGRDYFCFVQSCPYLPVE
jgi:hypothetical protein